MDIKSRLKELERDLLACDRISEEELASRIREIGFQCRRCGDCCTGEDNSVIVFPSEVRAIIEATGGSWLDIARPPSEGEMDIDGNFHTLEWRLAKCGESCKFYSSRKKDTEKEPGCGISCDADLKKSRETGCRIYEVRPALCSTYPFYLDDEGLQVSECMGLGGLIDVDASRVIAEKLIKRRRKEIMEAIALMERFEDFERPVDVNRTAKAKGKGICVVHDSEGEHRISFSLLPDFSPEDQS